MPPRIDVSRETEACLDVYLALLERWNARINLIGPAPREAWRARHIEDSLQLAGLLQGEGPLADLGSGAGLPGLVLAAATGRETHLVEADQRKAAFLREAAREMGLAHVTIHATRIETAKLPPIATLTARALAPLAALLSHTYNILAPGGIALFPKGRNADAELTEAAPHWHMAIERFSSRTDPQATIFRIRDLRPA